MIRMPFDPFLSRRDYASRRRARSGAAQAASYGLMRWLAPAALAAALGATALATPVPARADDALVRVLVDAADVIFRSGTPYYRHGGHALRERLVVVHDRYGRPHYYRYLPRDYRHLGDRRVKCNRRGRCKVEYAYYDPRYDRGRHHRVRYRQEWGDRRWDDDRDRRWRRVHHWRDRNDYGDG